MNKFYSVWGGKCMVVHDRKICTKVRKETNNYFYDINILSKFDAPKSGGAIAQ
ncbi:unnamed protein product [marine sediment metagenome]|uniref:Uncharacterized protein n=1 Tax=marine sediment metagenome TaxID=412755 RepID=X1DVT3_9ZZZZ